MVEHDARARRRDHQREPAGVAAGMKNPRWLQSGDVVEGVVEGLGTLTTHIVE